MVSSASEKAQCTPPRVKSANKILTESRQVAATTARLIRETRHLIETSHRELVKELENLQKLRNKNNKN
jgi:hypothetical protein